MNDARLERYGALAGIVFAVLIVLGATVGGTPPMPGDPKSEITSYFADNKDALRAAAYINGLAVIPFLWFINTVFGRLRRAEGGGGRLAGVALTGGVATVAVAMVANALTAAATLHPRGAPEDFRLSSILFGYAAFTIATFSAATAVVIVTTKFLPEWTGWLGALVAVGWLLGAFAVASERDAVASIGFIVFLVWVVWIVILSVLLFRTTEAVE